MNRFGVVIGCVLGLLLGGCAQEEADPLESYTDPGDACRQAISAISVADDVLEPVGQEHYQEFTNEVRSKISAVAGSLALEAHDWPDDHVRQQADVVQRLAAEARVNDATPEREHALLEYRGEAARLVLQCREAEGEGE